MSEISLLLAELPKLARKAGVAIMEVYDRGEGFENKQDGTPVTLADQRAEEIILAGLLEIAPHIPIVSEENASSHERAAAVCYFLVDPLDGTREFIKRDGKGAFTVNIALIENAEPVLGVIHAPALDRLFKGALGHGAFEGGNPISTRKTPKDGPVALASVSHRDEQTDQWLRENHIAGTVSIGSSLKFCMLAKGEADVYPRFGPTMEWDTAAGHAILNAAGGEVVNPDGSKFLYGKTHYRNGAFIARAQKSP